VRGATAPSLEAVILALETSCDDTCAAVLTTSGDVRSNVVSSQGIHDRYGGVVPEVASRSHLEMVNAVVDDALARARTTLDDVTLVAVTQGPGLVGALLVGLATAKALATPRALPLAPVDHLHGHVASAFLGQEEEDDPFAPPCVCLIASGGHTLLVRVEGPATFTLLGRTLDDAAGEAFDKGARLLGLPYPGGPALERLAAGGDPGAFAFPVARHLAGLDFSFSGLKTALLYKVRDLGPDAARERAPDLAAAYQQAIVSALAGRCAQALEQTGADRLALVGGVAANGALRAAAAGLAARVRVPALELCTDNAAMIGGAARHVAALPFPEYLGLDAYASGERALA